MRCILKKLPEQLFPPASDRKAWSDAAKKPLNKGFRKEIMQKADELLKEPIPDFSATLFMNFIRNGNRYKLEVPYFQRRRNLGILAVAECFEYKGKYLDRIIDYIWEITSEHTWCVPAHCWLKEDPFPEFPVDIVDLFNSETASVLALTMNLLEEEIKKISPNFVKMVKDKIIRRIAVPLENGPDPFWYEGLNNWTPWCCTNSLAGLLWALRDEPERLEQLIKKLYTAIQNFIRCYPEDGFCFEGPSYWAVSPGKMLGFFELLGEWDNHPKVKLMGEYIADTLMSSTRSMNFGDSPSFTKYPAWIIYRFGERVQSDTMKNMALMHLEQTDTLDICRDLLDALGFLFWLPEKIRRGKLNAKPLSFYDKTQFFVMRQNGVALAAKRGHAWSHQHLDIGHFMLFFREEPIIIDLGKAEYTRDTFTAKRWENDIMNSKGHNIPIFNHYGQRRLAEPAPGSMSCQEENGKIRCRMDLTTAYPEEAKLKSYVRELVFDKETNVLDVTDHWELESGQNEIYANFFTPAKVQERNGACLLGDAELRFEGCSFSVEKVKVTDLNQRLAWGKSLNRIQIRTKTGKQGDWRVSFLLKQEKILSLKKNKKGQTKK